MSGKPKKRLFGTNGVRGVVGKDMTPELAMRIAMALGSMRKGRVAVGRDTRTSGPALSAAVRAGLLACGCDVLDAGVLPTPALQYIVRQYADAGVMVTASHNPPEYNGIKVIEPDGTEMGDDEVVLLEERVFSRDFILVPWDAAGTEQDGSGMLQEYVDAIVGAFPAGIGEGMTVVADPGSGPACTTTPAILSALGCRVMTLNARPDGHFPGRLPEPSPEGLAALAELVVAAGAAFGVAHDGDADRAVFIDEKGQYLPEDREFALVQRQVCRENPGVVVTPVSSSRLAEMVAAETGSTVHYTPVGSISVARTMISLAKTGEKVVFGGEGNGGLIFPAHQHCRDGGMTAAMMVATLAREKTTLSELAASLPALCMLKEKIHTTDAVRIIDLVKKRFAGEKLDESDGVRINRDRSWALLRPSGTEPFMRLYVEADDEKTAQAFRDEILAALTDAGLTANT
jgi:phosphomannomutase/phosphoglucomutase